MELKLGDVQTTALIPLEIAHRQIPKMLCNLNTLVCAGMIASFGLEHRRLQIDEKLTEYRCSENCNG